MSISESFIRFFVEPLVDEISTLLCHLLVRIPFFVRLESQIDVRLGVIEYEHRILQTAHGLTAFLGLTAELLPVDGESANEAEDRLVVLDEVPAVTRPDQRAEIQIELLILLELGERPRQLELWMVFY